MTRSTPAVPRRRRGRFLVALAVASALLVFLPVAASAHPLGNFTINHFSGIRVGSSVISLDVVVDRAEIPTFSERQRLDTDGDGEVSATELEAERQVACGRLAADLDLTVAGTRLSLTADAAGVSFPPGAGGLSTMRIVCEYEARPTPPIARDTTIHFADTSDQGRIGWREIVAVGDGTTLAGSPPGATSPSERLTHYPADLLAVPLAMADASFTASPGGGPRPAACIPDAFPLNVTPSEATPGFGCEPLQTPGPASPGASTPDVGSVTPNAGPGSGSGSGSGGLASTVAAVPGGVGADVAGLLQTRDMTPPIVLFSILTAMALGAAHAITPGHGKTIMAAYLVGTRGTPRHAVALGLTVTASHTLGVLILALVILSVSRITPESFNHVAGIVSGLLVVAIGGWLFVSQGLPTIRGKLAEASAGRARAAAHAAAHAGGTAHAHGPAHEHDLEHHQGREHDHGREADHSHDHEHEHEHEHEHGGADDAPPVGWHEHGAGGHTHLPADGATLTWRSLFALGLFGGLVPSINALLILLATLATGRAAFGLVLVVAFGAGMAIVLGGIGLGLVYASRRMARTSSIPLRHLVAWAPALASTIIVAVGLWVTGQAIWGGPVL